MTLPSDCDIAIIGAGPVGLFMANLLGVVFARERHAGAARPIHRGEARAEPRDGLPIAASNTECCRQASPLLPRGFGRRRMNSITTACVPGSFPHYAAGDL